jgi:hypothetical protein
MHTTSGARSGALTDCVCLPGYSCQYTRTVTLRMALNTTMTLDELRADPSVGAALAQAVSDALGLAASSSTTSVTLEGFTASPSSFSAL